MERQVPLDDFSWLDDKTCKLCGGTGKVLGRKQDERSARWRRCACLGPKKRWKPPVGTRWANDQALAKRLGFQTQWEMRKARAAAKKRGYVEHGSADAATPLLDRLEAGSGPVRTIPVSEWRERAAAQPEPDMRHLAAVWR